MSGLELLPTLAPAPKTRAITAEEWAEQAALTDDGIATLRQLAELHAKAKKDRHAENTQETYDYWWGRLQAWMADPSQRVRGRALPAAPLSTLTSDTPGAQQILLLWLFELVYGPEDPEVLKEWIEDHGYLSPNTLHSVWSAVRCRLQDQTSRRFIPSTDTEAVFTGLHKFIREHYRAEPRRGGPAGDPAPRSSHPGHRLLSSEGARSTGPAGPARAGALRGKSQRGTDRPD